MVNRKRKNRKNQKTKLVRATAISKTLPAPTTKLCAQTPQNKKSVNFAPFSTVSFYHFNSPPLILNSSRPSVHSLSSDHLSRVFSSPSSPKDAFSAAAKKDSISKKPLLKTASLRVKTTFSRLPSRKEELFSNLLALVLADKPNSRLSLEKSGARVFRPDEVDRVLGLSPEDVGINLLFSKAEFGRIVRLPLGQLLAELKKTNLPFDAGCLSEAELKRFLKAQYAEEMKQCTLSKVGCLANELALRGAAFVGKNAKKLGKTLKKHLETEEKAQKKQNKKMKRLSASLAKKSKKELKKTFFLQFSKHIERQIEHIAPLSLIGQSPPFESGGSVDRAMASAFRLEFFLLAVERAREMFKSEMSKVDKIEDFLQNEKLENVDNIVLSKFVPIKKEHLDSIPEDRLVEILESMGVSNTILKIPLKNFLSELLFVALTIRFEKIFLLVLQKELQIYDANFCGDDAKSIFTKLELVFKNNHLGKE